MGLGLPIVVVLGVGFGALATWEQHHGGWGTGGRLFVIVLFVCVVIMFLLALAGEQK